MLGSLPLNLRIFYSVSIGADLAEQILQTRIRLVFGGVWSGFTPFFIPSASFGRITALQNQTVIFLGE